MAARMRARLRKPMVPAWLVPVRLVLVLARLVLVRMPPRVARQWVSAASAQEQ
jgi:hypothetical protein